MNPHFYTINETNKLRLNKPPGCDVVYYSELNEWFTTEAFRSFSIKYVVDHCIHYRSGNTEYEVKSGQFLLACQQPGIKAYFDSRDTVKSICIDIRPETIREAFTVMQRQGDHDFDNYRANHFRDPHFFETVCPLSASIPFAGHLQQLVRAIYEGKGDDLVNQEWFLGLAEQVIYHEYGNYLALNSIESARLATRKELLRRLLIGRQWMDESFLEISDIRQIASCCHLSEFHFFRSFRQAFGITPYQYLLKKRLQLAHRLILQSEWSISAIALHCNFPDLFTFSKAFKRAFGKAPSLLRSNNG